MKNTEEQTILLIEDNPGDSRLIIEMLKEITSNNYQLFVAETLKEGCEQIRKYNFILILLDLNLPDSRGKHTFDMVMKIAEKAPVVLVSGLDDEELSLSLIEEGAQDYILKQDLNRNLLSKIIQYALIRKKAEEELKASKDFLDKIINSVASPIFVKDDQHRFCLVNDALCSLLNLSVEKLIGTTGYEFFPEEQMKIFIAKDQEVFKSGKENINEEQLTDGTGKIQNIVIRKTIYTDTLGKKYLVGVINDITENRRYEKELIIAKEHAEESDRLQSAFLANMSHEIRTPMNGILGFSELLKEPGLNGEKQQEYIRIIEKSGARMLNIINDIVDISKIEANLMSVDIKDSNINEKIEFIYIFFKPQVEEKGMQLLFKNSLPTEEATIRTDNEKVYSILTNLVKNAIKYSNEGTIEFGYLKKGENLEFYVKDTGIGIPKDRQEAIFERFIQADISDKMARQGAGLGLSISKAYVEMLGGKIWVESEEGIGSTFYFTLPYNSEPEEKKVVGKVVPAQDEKNQIKKLKILIAEDDLVSEMLITIDVEDFSKEILNAKNGFEAVEVCRNNPDTDLILMDIQMPVLNGHEATRQIRQFNKEVVIIAQTAFGLSGDREKAIEAGCNDYIKKPINKAELLSLIQKYFKK
jgi:PAS domain S-box-containing protein